MLTSGWWPAKAPGLLNLTVELFVSLVAVIQSDVPCRTFVTAQSTCPVEE
jgi:hypothetical protein